MAKIKQAAGNELHWSIESWNQGKDANNHLRNIIRDESLRSMFANVSVSNSIIVWNHPDPDWQMLSAADEATAKAVRAFFGNQEAKLKAKAPSYAERLMRVPNEDYIFFKITPEGNIKLLLTGWGYTNSKKAEGSSYRKKVQLDPVCDIKVGFSVNGEPVPFREFDAMTPNGSSNRCVTGADGLIEFKSMTVGGRQHVHDVISGKNFEFTVDPLNAVNIFDVTQIMNLLISATKDNIPVADGNVEVEIDGENEILHLENGRASLSKIWNPGMSANVSFLGETKQIELKPGENFVEFALQSPPVVEPEPEPEPEPIEIEEEEKEIEEILPPLPEIPEPMIVVTVLDVKGHPLANTEITMRQPKNIPPLPPHPGQPKPHNNPAGLPPAPGQPGLPPVPPVPGLPPAPGQPPIPPAVPAQKGEVIETPDEVMIKGRLGQDGRIAFPASALKPDVAITTSLANAQRSFQPIIWSTEEGELEYILQELPEKGSPIPEILALFGYVVGTILFSIGLMNLTDLLYNKFY